MMVRTSSFTIVLALTCSVVHAGLLGSANFNDGSGNADGLTYTQGSITIGEAGANKGRDAAAYFVNLTPQPNSGAIYFSALVQRIDSEITSGDWGGLSLFAGGTELIYFGAMSTTRVNWGIEGKGGDGNNVSEIAFNNSLAFVVGMVDYDANIARLWINPDFGAAPPLTADASINSFNRADASTRLRLQAAQPADMRFDEVLVGTTWGDVVPVPEPSTLLLAALAGFGALAMLRRRGR
jgi:hypothetical protein